MSKTFVKPKLVMLDYRFLGTTLLGAVSVSVAWAFGTTELQLGILATWVSILAGLLVTQIRTAESIQNTFTAILHTAGVIPTFVEQQPILDNYLKITRSLSILAVQSDPVLIDVALQKLDLVTEQVHAVAHGEVLFASTESWRKTYEKILRGKGLKEYRSVAWFKSLEYWQDEPGLKSLELNLELHAGGLSIQRIVIIRDELWAPCSRLPDPTVLSWIEQQHRQGIKISLIRESELAYEPELCRDFGIYDDRAVGVHELDDRCRTMVFTLHFGKKEIDRAESQWQSLALYARSFEELASS